MVKLRDDVIWIGHVEGDPVLRDRLARLPPGGAIALEVDGVPGHWEKMRDGRDGRPTPGIKPVGPMFETWKRWQSRRGEIIAIREVAPPDGYLASLRDTLTEWDSPEDDEAFRDL